MAPDLPKEFAIIAGRGVYPLLLAESARRQGAERIFAIAFTKETDRAIEKLADEVRWMPIGQLAALLDALRQSGVKHVVLAGLIAPSHLFSIRLDALTLSILKALPQKNAHTIFGALVAEIHKLGMDVLPASAFMADYMPGPGVLTRRSPTDAENRDIALGLHVATATSALDIGQTVVIKDGTILAVEAFEGTDETILRAGLLGGQGVVVVKVAKRRHDMRFDIPALGVQTIKTLAKARASTLAVQAGRAIVLEQQKVVAMADKLKLCLTVLPSPKEES